MSLPRVQVVIHRGIDLPAMDSGKSSDPYIKFEYRGTQYRTETVKKSVNPVWNQQFTFVYDKAFGPHTLTLELWDANVLLKDKKMGFVTINLQTLEENKVQNKYYPLEDAALAKIGGALQIELRLLPPHSEMKYSSGSGQQKVVVLTAEQARAAAQGRLLIPANQTHVGFVSGASPSYRCPLAEPAPAYGVGMPHVMPPLVPYAAYPQYPIQASCPPPVHPPQPIPFSGSCVPAPPPQGGSPSWLWQAPRQGSAPGPYSHPSPQSPATSGFPVPSQFVGNPAVVGGPDATQVGHKAGKNSDSSSSDNGSSSEGEAKKTQKGAKKDRSKKKPAESILIMEIKDIVPSATYGEIAKALVAHNNDKDLALKQLVANLSTNEQGNI
ncbi:C2 domain protein [Toxoplasma gondii TgCatPRC2]|uniref:C2 domain protein n=1 Tax=Toxoplasma gondii TgCatPRC2 TaxID=1130821 RepID=A0A151H3N2_TOXGO|nr:C2 domain protein [Toxoplasma gondii TgCatPRC2]